MRNKLTELLLELIYPSLCSLCEQKAETNLPLCSDCLEKIEPIRESKCALCGKALIGEPEERLCGDCLKQEPFFDCARSFARYQEPMIQILHRFKYQRGFYFRDWMVRALIEVYQREYQSEKFDFIIPVPLHWKRLLNRGYNQALILAKPLSKKLKIPLLSGTLLRIRNTQPQFGLSPNQRAENIKKSFSIKNKKIVEGKNILVVDDIITTGITMNEIAKTLKKAGAKRVCCLALARV